MMEPSFIGTPYGTASSPNSKHIRELLDKQEVEYESWRSNRKPLRHPFVTAKLNSPLKTIPKLVAKKTEKPLWMSLLERESIERPKSTTRSESERRDSSIARPGSTRSSICTIGTTSRRQSSAVESVALSSAQPVPTLPSISKNRVRINSVTNNSSRRILLVGSPDHRLVNTKSSSIAKKKLRKHLYDFHTSVVFSLASDTKECPNNAVLGVPEEDIHGGTVEVVQDVPSVRLLDVVTANGQSLKHNNEHYLIKGLPVMNTELFEQIFKHDWDHSDVERIVRDAVERKRIYHILKGAYRVIILFARFYACKAALSGQPGTTMSDLHQVPSRLSILEDLNIQQVDPAKFGIVDSPIHRDGLVDFLLNVAKMVAATPNNPIRFRMLAAEGIEVSEAAKVLIHDHLNVFGQIQDPNHFRLVFLREPKEDRSGAKRELKMILSRHEPNLRNFYRESLNSTQVLRFSDSPATVAPRSRTSVRVPVEAPTAMGFMPFLAALKTINLIPTKRTKRPAPIPPEKAQGGGADQELLSSFPITEIDENRAMKVFLLCLGVGVSSDCPIETKQLLFPQFLEALLRIALIRKERDICRGQYDVCPDQVTSQECRCVESRSREYDFDAFNEAVEDLFAIIHFHRMVTARRRTTVKMASVRSLQQYFKEEASRPQTSDKSDDHHDSD